MKKIFVVMMLAIMLFTNCKKYNDAEIRSSINDLKARVERLEKLCSDMNTNISSLQAIVAALQKRDAVVSVTDLPDNRGYTILFASGKSIYIYNGKDGSDGKDGVDGQNGLDGHTPSIGIKQGADGTYYWTLDGEWIVDDSGNKIKAEGTNGTDGKNGTDAITPRLKIEEDYWFVSYDNGITWVKLNKAIGKDGKDGMDGSNITITQDKDNCYVTLPDGSVITLQKSNSTLKSDIIHFEDPYVKDICVRQWDTDKDGELSYSEASVVETIGSFFTHTEYVSYYDKTFKTQYYTLIKAGNSSIRSFTEFKYFTSIRKLNALGFTSDINLVKVELPDSLEEICDGATSNVLRYEWNAGGKIGLVKYSLGIFSRTGLSEISLPATIRKIGNYAFIACPYLSEVYCYSLNPPVLGDNVFGNSVKNIFVPSESVDLYKSALGWKEYSDLIKAL